ncbi:ANTAR domain-containing protein [Microlunatus capsulatus]|uniref:ANTAR domain-containing protein n=1 Tax=Microlunatus capsulatus TaxID=99117 RepID=A0ABS4Z7K5_9ACTN|nr:ANTAR domain-containing protein [Microlunatus capsulatus]MBP2417024.1 hypothetical protein [Microlunatus capsulatus]
MTDAPATHHPATHQRSALRGVRPGPWSDPWDELSEVLRAGDEGPLRRLLQRVVDGARSLVPELGEVSVTLVEEGRPRTAVAAGRLAAFLDEQQHALGEGPGLDAAAAGGTVAVTTTDPETPYPAFSGIAAQHGITRVLAVALTVEPPDGGAAAAGALTLYVATSRPLSPGSVALTRTFADYAAVAVAVARAARHPAVAEARRLREAMSTRAVIEQAKGVVMGTRNCSAEQAWALLLEASRTQDRVLRDVALDLVTRAG